MFSALTTNILIGLISNVHLKLGNDLGEYLIFIRDDVSVLVDRFHGILGSFNENRVVTLWDLNVGDVLSSLSSTCSLLKIIFMAYDEGLSNSNLAKNGNRLSILKVSLRVHSPNHKLELVLL